LSAMTIAAATIAEQYPAKMIRRCTKDMRELLLVQFGNVGRCAAILPKPINGVTNIV